MKNILLLLMIALPTICKAQISQSIVNKEKFEKSGFPFKGTRVLMVENISAENEENYFVLSKNDKNSTQDELYIEQFTKENDKWVLKISEKIAEKNIVTSTWNNRKVFADVDKDGKADVLLIYSKHEKENLDNQLEVVLILFHNYQLYSISTNASTNNSLDFFSENFKELPIELKEYAIQYWNSLDK